jgi:general secretion pathway protein B
MSSILKALKRLEQQKVARRDNSQDLSLVLRTEAPPSAFRRGWPLITAGLAVVAAAAALLTYSLMGGFSGRPSPVGRQALNGDAGTAGPEPRAELPKVENIVERMPASSINEQPVVSPKIHASEVKPPGHVKVPLVRIAESVPAPVRKPAKTEAEKPVPRPRPAAASLAAPPAATPQATPKLSVSGIAWQKDTPNPLAIVNGSPVGEGSSVGGARVEKIFPDRVRFSYGSKVFEVGMNPSQ